MDHVGDEDEVRDAQGHQLHQPETEERDGGEKVVAHVGTAGLDGVAHKALLLVLVEGVPGEEEDEDTEEDHHNEPELPLKRNNPVRLSTSEMSPETLKHKIFNVL